MKGHYSWQPEIIFVQTCSRSFHALLVNLVVLFGNVVHFQAQVEKLPIATRTRFRAGEGAEGDIRKHSPVNGD